jgi:hypothetical protein
VRRTQAAFELQVLADDAGEGGLRLALWQRAVAGNGADARPHLLATLGGVPLQVGMDQVLEAVRREGYRATALWGGRQEPLALSEETGVRLGLLFLALRPLSKVSRMERIAAGVRAMPSEEAYYWFSKCAGPRRGGGGHARRALRILLAGE